MRVMRVSNARGPVPTFWTSIRAEEFAPAVVSSATIGDTRIAYAASARPKASRNEIKAQRSLDTRTALAKIDI